MRTSRASFRVAGRWAPRPQARSRSGIMALTPGLLAWCLDQVTRLVWSSVIWCVGGYPFAL